MTTLAANVNADAERWTLDSLPSTQYVQVDDETVEVRAMFPSSTYSLTGETLPPRIRVRRGIAGTTKASHLSGATLTPNYGLGGGEGGGAIAVTDGVTTVAAATSIEIVGGSVTDAGGGVAEVVVQPRILGPYRVTWETPGIADVGGTPAEIAADVIPAGATIIKAWAVPVATWAVPTSSAKAQIYVGPAAEQSAVFRTLDATGGAWVSPLNQHSYLSDATDADTLYRTYSTQVVSSVWARVVDVTDESAPTDGSMDAYVLIAIPAAG